jgi:hypothetical protein
VVSFQIPSLDQAHSHRSIFKKISALAGQFGFLESSI